MSDRHDPDAILAAWLDEGPTSLPSETRRSLLETIHTTPTKRRSAVWPTREDLVMFMTPPRMVATSLVALLIAGSGIGFLLGDHTPSAPGGPAAQSPVAPSSAFTSISGTSACTEPKGGTPQNVNGIVVTRGATFECTNDVDDSRVGGTWTNTWNRADPVGSDVSPVIWWGTSQRDDSTGAWDCSWVLPGDPDDTVFLVLSNCRGSGDYEGLAYVFEHVMGGPNDGALFGYIYEGAPFGEWVPAAD
jgi:hypothetical protein